MNLAGITLHHTPPEEMAALIRDGTLSPLSRVPAFSPLDAYPPAEGGLLATLSARIDANPFNAVVTGIFLLAIAHTFLAARFSKLAHDVQHRHDARRRAAGLGPQPSLPAELLPYAKREA